MFDPRRRKPKLKLYRDKDGNVKGDGLCCYIKVSAAAFSKKMEMWKKNLKYCNGC